MKQTLVGIDDSSHSRTALRVGATLASARGERLRAVTSWEYPATTPLPTHLSSRPGADEVDAELEQKLRELVAEALPDHDEADLVLRVRRGPPGWVLVHEADPQHTSMLVVGARGIGGFRGLLLGSVSRRCLEQGRVPIIVVPDGASAPSSIRRIVVGVDGSDNGERALRWAAETATASGAELLVIHALVPLQAELPPATYQELREHATEALDRWTEPLGQESVTFRTAVIDDDPRQALVDVVEREGADLLVVGARGAGPLRNLLVGSTANALVQRSPVPIAVVPPTRPEVSDPAGAA